MNRLLTGVVLLAVTVTPAAADPVGTVPLDPQRIETPLIRVVDASPAGVLYTVSHPDLYLSGGAPPGREQVTWLKPTGGRPTRLDSSYRVLRGDFAFSTRVSGRADFRRVSTGETGSCPVIGRPTFVPDGWLSINGTGRLTRTTVFCHSETLAELPGSTLAAADERGFLVRRNGALWFASYADPTELRQVATGNTHDRPLEDIVLHGDAVAWKIQNSSSTGEPPKPYGWVFRGSTTGAAPVETVVDHPVTSLAITPTHTGWATDGPVMAQPASRFGTIAVGSSTSVERVGPGSVVSDGVAFLVDGPAGVERTGSAGGAATLVQPVDRLSPLAGAVALGAGRVVYVDSRGNGTSARVQRSYRPGRPPALGPERVIGAGVDQVSQDGRRTAYATSDAVWLQTEGAAPRRLFATTDEDRFVRTGLRVSGTRVLWVVMRADAGCHPPNCAPPRAESVYLYDERTRRTTVAPARDAVYGLWGNYLVSGKPDGIVYRRDLSSNRIIQVKGKGLRVTSVDVHGSYVGWSSCDPTCSVSRVGYRNMATGTAPVELVTRFVHDVRLTGGYLVHGVERADTRTLQIVRLGTRIPHAIGSLLAPLWVGDQRDLLDAHDETVAWTGADMTARVGPLPAYADRPRYLGNALGSPSFIPSEGGRWTVEFPISKALPVCGVTIRQGTRLVRALGCANATGSAVASWDGRDSSGRLVPRGRYTWTFAGRDADGAAVWWHGGTTPIRGTVSVV